MFKWTYNPSAVGTNFIKLGMDGFSTLFTVES